LGSNEGVLSEVRGSTPLGSLYNILNTTTTDQPSLESDRIDVELFDDLKLVVHVLQQTQHLQSHIEYCSHHEELTKRHQSFTACVSAGNWIQTSTSLSS